MKELIETKPLTSACSDVQKLGRLNRVSINTPANLLSLTTPLNPIPHGGDSRTAMTPKAADYYKDMPAELLVSLKGADFPTVCAAIKNKFPNIPDSLVTGVYQHVVKGYSLDMNDPHVYIDVSVTAPPPRPQSMQPLNPSKKFEAEMAVSKECCNCGNNCAGKKERSNEG